jgi:phosphohistidine phosphatase
MRTLHLVRHAKSDWSDGSLPDRRRPLNARGDRARKVIARHVRGWPVDLVVTSDAVRARRTARAIAEVLGCPLETDAALYDEGHHAAGLLTIVHALPDRAASVMLVGHNPGVEELGTLLDATCPGFPTAALASFELDVSGWAEVAAGSGRLTAFVTARQLGEG